MSYLVTDLSAHNPAYRSAHPSITALTCLETHIRMRPGHFRGHMDGMTLGQAQPSKMSPAVPVPCLARALSRSCLGPTLVQLIVDGSASGEA
jgi:hypothetical protein